MSHWICSAWSSKPHLCKPIIRPCVMMVEKSLTEALQAPFLSSSVSCSSCASAAPTHHLELLLLFLLHPPPSLCPHVPLVLIPTICVLLRCNCTFPLPLAQDPGCCGPEKIYLGQKSHSAAPGRRSAPVHPFPPCGIHKVQPRSLELMKRAMRTYNNQVPMEWVLAPFQTDFK